MHISNAKKYRGGFEKKVLLSEFSPPIVRVGISRSKQKKKDKCLTFYKTREYKRMQFSLIEGRLQIPGSLPQMLNKQMYLDIIK